MRRALTAVVVAIAATIAAGPLGAPAVMAQSQSVQAWVEIATPRPGAGCHVDASVEVRSGGAAVSGAEVILAVSVDGGGEVLSSERATTDESGIAHLGFGTGSASNGAKTWMDVLVNGSYIGGRTIWVTDGACDGASSLLDLSGEVPTIADTVVETPAQAENQAASNGGEVIIPGVVAYQQQRPLSCEYAAVAIATGALGSWVDEYAIEGVTPLSDNPHTGYRGNIWGAWGNTTDYGIYADALVPSLAQFGFTGHSFYGGRADLIASIDQGRPTLVWLGLWGDQSHDEYSADGTRYQLTAGMHVMVAYGYDNGGVYLSDPGTGSLRYYDWGTFEGMWNVMDGMALGISW
jgi:uncharacterized protein YvpB